ncbi:MAG TPA: prepilin-type N-terminal cleavage/methylation domain-containing protein [Anaerohalosphaeraceae bacterium]|nr:prepilin-type N-terminal cleavage/methylation domain-containing protein [Anaerohalosphaeraceae bacterium]HOL31652.1 prepilin-type N-terminal cleavage/methylation domain-containing protein [Anaerohalosphaeraceae bacterium]HOM76790.1 prepilin-type N-terminal cleavage/methylation domain-containing protein [Anaerohalosphaeraceae bacterium]HPC64979.1 prepilin-type N-terminal cleavage/methylation domain-containing protein [Anaerohalosphaeraceae bacterium]HPO70330.1 prepilin-type N-terminal cleavag
MPAKRLQHAFTLIELLAVLAVIALMLSVVLPALRQAKEAARTVQCKTLMKNYALAFYSYFWQTNTLFPLSIQDWQNNIPMHPWHSLDEFRALVDLEPTGPEYRIRRTGQLQEYKPAFPRRFICPSARYALEHPEDGLYPMNRSFGLNAHVYYFKDYVRRRLESQSSRISCMADALDWWFSYWQCDIYLQTGEQWLGFDTYGSAAFRHRDKANISYWDGHVEQMAAGELKEHLNQWRYYNP